MRELQQPIYDRSDCPGQPNGSFHRLLDQGPGQRRSGKMVPHHASSSALIAHDLHQHCFGMDQGCVEKRQKRGWSIGALSRVDVHAL